ncbi:dihydrofolate reductase family protein [Chitinophaga sp.]|uniref:dihydrofolate reductase family protein n=1 Tax=Chitinophaga sp. TaxID=1869181 RepID=UPI0026226751|nr:dihydrofolate reductase family protein [uncultured Chitinophaga sp.]
MRKLFVSNLASLDGYIAGPNREIDWHNVDGEYESYGVKMMNSSGAILFGRITYDLMAGYWPGATDNNPEVTRQMNELPKYVFSNSLQSVSWNNAHLVKEPMESFVRKLKEEDGNDIVLLGSGTIVSQLTALRLIDEYRIFTVPVLLGGGIPAFPPGFGRTGLELVSSREFSEGNVLNTYWVK